jgi:hypothetical protein
MTPVLKRRLQRYSVATLIAVVPLAILCAYVANLLVPTEPLPRPVRYDAAALNIINTAVINEESTTVGIADSDMYNPNLTEAEVRARFDDMEALGVDTLRVLVPWGAIQRVPPGDPLEQFFPPDWERIDLILSLAEEKDMAVLGVLNATPYWGREDGAGCALCPPQPGAAPDPELFAAFAAEAADRFQDMYPGVVSAYEVWNEPNSFRSWSPVVDPVAYTEVLKAAYTAIKGVDPDATVVAGVLGAVVTVGGFTMDPVTFVEQMYANDAKGFFDAISYHPYNYDRTLAEQNPNFLSPLRALLEMRQVMLDNEDDALRIWATEYGLPTYLDEDQEAAYAEQERFIRDFLTTWANGLTDAQMAQLPDEFQELADSWEEWIGPAFIYSLRDRLGEEDTEQGSFGLFYFDEATGEWQMKPAAEFIKELLEDPETPGGGLGEALAASLQALFQSVANSLSSVLQLQVVPQITQSVQALGAQIGDALANALAAWVGSIRLPGATATAADVEAVDTMALAQTAVADTFEEAAREMPATEAAAEAATEAPALAAPAPVEETPAPVEEAPAPVEETPAPVEEAPEPVEETTEPEVTEPEVTEPEVTEPEVTEPEVTEPEVTEPEDTESEEPAPSDESPTETPGNQDESDDESSTDPDEQADQESDEDANDASGESPDGNAGNDDASDNDDTTGSAGSPGSPGAGGNGPGGNDGSSGSSGSDGSDGSGGGDSSGGGGGSDNVSVVIGNGVLLEWTA